MEDPKSHRKMSRRSILRATALGAGTSLVASRLPYTTQALAASTVDDAVEWAKANLPKSTPDIVRAAAKEGHLTLTTQNLGGNPDILNKLIAAFNTHYPFLAVEYTTQATVQLLNKFNAELSAKKGITDFINLPSDMKTVSMLEQQGALMPFAISEDEGFLAAAKHSGSWYALRSEYPSTLYRKGALSEDELRLIRTFEGIADPRFKNRLAAVAVENSAAAAGCYILLTHADPKIWRGLADNKPRVKSAAAALLDGLLSGEYDVAILGGIAAGLQAAQQGAPVEFGISAPFPPIYTPGAVSALAPHPNAAKLWQDWIMSAEGQSMWVKVSGFGTARTDVKEKTWFEQQPWFFKDDSKEVDIDWDDFAKKQPEIIERFKKDMQAG